MHLRIILSTIYHVKLLPHESLAIHGMKILIDSFQHFYLIFHFLFALGAELFQKCIPESQAL